MKRVALQAELELPRKRVTLLDDAEVQVKTDQRGEAGLRVSYEDFVGYTPWSDGNPPTFGYWEVKMRWLEHELADAESHGNNYRARVLRMKQARNPDGFPRYWFDAKRSIWRTDPDGPMVGCAGRQWRGLAAPWLAGYGYDLVTGEEESAV